MKFLIVFLLFSCMAFSAFPTAVDAQSASFPSPVGFVNDYANVLTGVSVLENELTEYEKNTTIEITIVTLAQLPEGQTLFTYGVELFQDWQIGKKGEDNGILVLIVPNGTTGNRLRIELGYGVQGYITGAEAGRILDEALPYYEEGDYQSTAKTIIAGLKEQLVSYQPGVAVEKGIDPSTIFTIFFILFYAFMIIFPMAYTLLGPKCPNCKSRKLECKYDDNSNSYVCTCKKCGHTFKKKRSHFVFLPIAVGGFSGGGGSGFGGFGGGGSGGGGAGS